MDRKKFDDFCKRYMEYVESEEGQLDWLAQIYELLNGRNIMQDFKVLEIEVGIGMLKVH